MNNIKRLLTVLLCAALLSTCVFAQYVDPYRDDCTLTVRCKHEVEGVIFSIWQVGKIDQNAGFTKTSDFAGARVNLNNTGDWADLAETLAGFAESRKIDPLETDDTNKQGRAVFRDLRAGLYLVVGSLIRWTIRSIRPSLSWYLCPPEATTPSLGITMY